MRTRYFISDQGSFATALLRYAASLAVITGTTATFGIMVLQAAAPLDLGSTPGEIMAVPRVAAEVLESDAWAQNLRSETFWSKRTSVAISRSDSNRPDFGQRSSLINARPAGPAAIAKPVVNKAAIPPPKGERTDGSSWYEGDGGTHRTVCVRLCDGYFWPISFSTDSDNFERDTRVCERSCSAPTRLFIHENPGQDLEQMVDLKGNPYTRLRTANLFRSNFDESCKCNAHPWEQASKDRHRMYALEAEARKGSRQAAAELAQMRATLVAARKAAAANVKLAAVKTSSITTGAIVPNAGTGVRPERSAPAATLEPMKRSDALVTPVVVSSHMPLSGLLTVPQSLVPQAAKSDRLVQMAQSAQQLLPPIPPKADTKTERTNEEITVQFQNQMQVSLTQPQVGMRQGASAEEMNVPAAPFALAATAPVVPGLAEVVAVSKAQTSLVPAKPHGLAVAAPPIIGAANAELGIQAPFPVNTAQLEQVNRQPESSKSAVAKPEKPKSEQRKAEPRVAEPAPRRVEPRVVERREPEPRPAPRREPPPERRDVRPAPPPRVVERPARVVEAPRPTPQVSRPRPTPQVTSVRDNWRERVFQTR
jgi:hypothetical protein